MEPKDFSFNPDLKCYTIIINRIEISIDENQMSDKIIILAEKISGVYPQKLREIAKHLSTHDSVKCFFGNLSEDEIAARLHEPYIRVDEYGGVLSYCNHELDENHIIDVEFSGALEKFRCVSVDG